MPATNRVVSTAFLLGFSLSSAAFGQKPKAAAPPTSAEFQQRVRKEEALSKELNTALVVAQKLTFDDIAANGGENAEFNLYSPTLKYAHKALDAEDVLVKRLDAAFRTSPLYKQGFDEVLSQYQTWVTQRKAMIDEPGNGRSLTFLVSRKNTPAASQLKRLYDNSFVHDAIIRDALLYAIVHPICDFLPNEPPAPR